MLSRLITGNMAILNPAKLTGITFESLCDRGILFSLIASIFVLPASIAYLDSLVGLAVLCYFLKKIAGILRNWAQEAGHLNFLGKLQFILKGFAPPDNCLNRPLQFLTLAIFLSVVFSQYPMLSLMAFLGKFVKGVFVYCSFLEAFNSKSRMSVFLALFFISAFIMILDGAYQSKTGKDFFKHNPITKNENDSMGRINASFNDANGFGAYFLPVIALVINFLSKAFSNRKWFAAVLFSSFLALLLVTLCWTYSRSAWIGLLVLLIGTVILDWRKIFLVTTIIMIFVIFFLPSLNKVRHMELIKDSSGSQQSISYKSGLRERTKTLLEEGGSGRLAYWKNAISIIRSSPIVGTGLNTYTKIIQRNPDKRTWWYAHNCYLQMTAETGFVGLGCFLFMLFVLFKHGLFCHYQIKDEWILTSLQGALTGLFGLMVQSFFDNTLYSVQLSMLIWFMIGFAMALTRLGTSR